MGTPKPGTNSTLTGTNLQYAKHYNTRIVLEAIRLHHPISRLDISKITRLTAQTVTNITRELIKTGLIQESGRVKSGRGAPSILLTLNPDSAFAIGLDLDKDHLTGVLIDMLGHVRQRLNLELNFPTADEAMSIFEKAATQLMQSEGIPREKLWGIGVALPGPINIIKEQGSSRVVVNPKLMPGWQDVPVADLLAERLKLPVYLENNASAAAFSERWYGDGQNFDTFFYVYFGAGLGGGLVIKGQLHSGYSGNAGEIGYLPTSSFFEDDGQIEHAHLGLSFNVPALFEMLQEEGFDAKTQQDLEALFLEKNPVLMRWIEEGARKLAPAMLAVEYIIDPEAIFLGGRLPDCMINELLSQLQRFLPDLHFRENKQHPKLRKATAGVEAGALGVAMIPLYTFMSPLPTVLMKGEDQDQEKLNGGG